MRRTNRDRKNAIIRLMDIMNDLWDEENLPMVRARYREESDNLISEKKCLRGERDLVYKLYRLDKDIEWKEKDFENLYEELNELNIAKPSSIKNVGILSNRAKALLTHIFRE